MGFGVRPAVRDHLCGLPDAAAHPESVVPLVRAAHQSIQASACPARRRALDVVREQTLLGDIGGTTARFAVLTGDTLSAIDHLPVSEYRSLVDAIHGFLDSHQDRNRIDAAVLGVAAPVEGGRSVLVNSQ